jgi:hypothetical protein
MKHLNTTSIPPVLALAVKNPFLTSSDSTTSLGPTSSYHRRRRLPSQTSACRLSRARLHRSASPGSRSRPPKSDVSRHLRHRLGPRAAGSTCFADHGCNAKQSVIQHCVCLDPEQLAAPYLSQARLKHGSGVSRLQCGGPSRPPPRQPLLDTDRGHQNGLDEEMASCASKHNLRDTSLKWLNHSLTSLVSARSSTNPSLRGLSAVAVSVPQTWDSQIHCNKPFSKTPVRPYRPPCMKHVE